MMSELRLVLMTAVVVVLAGGCVTSDSVMSVPVVPVSRAVAAYSGEVSVEEAKEMFGISGEVCEIWTGDTSQDVTIAITDESEKTIFLYTRRLEMWGRGVDRHFVVMLEKEEVAESHIDIEKSNVPRVSRPGREWGEILRSDRCFKAFTVLCMDWVDRKFTPREKRMLRESRQKMGRSNAYYIALVFGIKVGAGEEIP